MPPFDGEPQTFLDPLNTQSELYGALLDLFERMMSSDPAYRERLVRHYEMWKAAVDDPSHPDHRNEPCSRLRSPPAHDPVNSSSSYSRAGTLFRELLPQLAGITTRVKAAKTCTRSSVSRK